MYFMSKLDHSTVILLSVTNILLIFNLYHIYDLFAQL